MASMIGWLRRLLGQKAGGNPTTQFPAAFDGSHIPELELFNSLSATLEIDLTEPAVPLADLSNMAAPSAAEVQAVRLEAKVFLPETKDFRELTPAELSSVAFPEPEIKLCGESGNVVHHEAPNGENFSVQDLLRAIEETERQTRGKSEWFGGVDIHHCFFEGIRLAEQDIWCVNWGS